MKTQVYHIEGCGYDQQQLLQAAEILRAGGLVIIPTETVYGIAARGDEVGFDALNAIKGRDLSKFYSLYIPDSQALGRYVPSIDMRTAKLVHNFLPGPVTIVFNLTDQEVKEQIKSLGKKWAGIYKDNSIAVRCPDNEATCRLLELADIPIVATGAGLSGMPAATDFEQAFNAFNTKVPFMFNDGECGEKIGSTVVRISNGSIDVLREGAVDSQEIADISTVDIIFVCSSNTCRSPLAAEICKKQLAARLGCDTERLEMFGYKIRSAGVMAPLEKPIRQEAVNLANELGFDLSRHISTPLVPRDLLCCDLILAMQQEHRDRIISFYPQLADKCRLVADDYDICSPSDGNGKVYAKFAQILENAIEQVIGEILI
jgi:tRNA threonylcarbamoyl adenosine modification protein (Sua5/YciO/YrdC/YwlC family)